LLSGPVVDTIADLLTMTKTNRANPDGAVAPLSPARALSAREPIAAGRGPAQDPRGHAAKKPMARATRIALFEREIRERLSRSALDLLFARAEVISEGQRALRAGRDSYFGSTMLTLDLPVLAALLRDACDAGTARRLAALLEGDAGVAQRIQALTARETARVAGATPREVRTHVAIRSQGAKVFIDVDVEASF
jgi:hypothetical protein